MISDESRSQWTEDRLGKLMGDQWTFDPALPLSAIDGTRSLMRRLGGPRWPDPTEIARFQASMKAGATFPAILCIRADDGQLEVFDGLRVYLAAHNLGRDKIAAYIVPAAAEHLLYRPIRTRAREALQGLRRDRVVYAENVAHTAPRPPQLAALSAALRGNQKELDEELDRLSLEELDRLAWSAEDLRRAAVRRRLDKLGG